MCEEVLGYYYPLSGIFLGFLQWWVCPRGQTGYWSFLTVCGTGIYSLVQNFAESLQQARNFVSVSCINCECTLVCHFCVKGLFTIELVVGSPFEHWLPYLEITEPNCCKDYTKPCKCITDQGKEQALSVNTWRGNHLQNKVSCCCWQLLKASHENGKNSLFPWPPKWPRFRIKMWYKNSSNFQLHVHDSSSLV